jgi:transcriptional regulator with XRE-family HTH domain
MRERGLTFRGLATLTQAHDADGCGVTYAYLCGVTSGREYPSRRSIELIAASLDLEPDHFAEYRLAELRRQLNGREVGFEAAGRHTTRARSLLERPAHLVGAQRRLTAGVEVSQPLGRDPAIFSVDQLLVALDQIGGHDRGGAVMPATPGDVGDLTAKRRAVDRVREMVSCLTDRQLGLVLTHPHIIANNAKLASQLMRRRRSLWPTALRRGRRRLGAALDDQRDGLVC